MSEVSDQPSSGGRKAPLSLNVIVVGSGIGGLSAAYGLSSAGHKVTVLESKPELSSLGAGIVCTTNMVRVLRRWGLSKRLEEASAPCPGMNIRRWDNGQLLRSVKFEKSKHEHFSMHRAELHGLLREIALPNVTLRLSCKVVSVDPEAPSVTLASGETLRGDLIVGADGIRSYTRSVVIGQPDEAEATGDAADRDFFMEEEISADPDTKWLLDAGMECWVGPGRHAITYPVMHDGKKKLFMSLLHPDIDAVESWFAPGNAEEMKADFGSWAAPLTKAIALSKQPLRYKLMDRKPLKTWVHPAGKVTLLGDACHPMLPYQAQGGAMAIEDGAVLGNIFSRVSHLREIPLLLQAYQNLRYDRCTGIQLGSRRAQHLWHLNDGDEQVKRDEWLKTLPPGEADANLLAQYEYDADKEVETWWQKDGEASVAALHAKAQ